MTVEDRIRTLLRYDPKTGNLFWIACPVPAGQTQAATWGSLRNRPAGQRKENRILVVIDGRRYEAHQLAFFLHHGRWPAAGINHINGDGLDNRLVNLREASHEQSMQNRKQHRNNKSGFPGVRWHKRAGKWEAFVRYQGKLKYLGLFERAELAAEAARSARQELFGAFFRDASAGVDKEQNERKSWNATGRRVGTRQTTPAKSLKSGGSDGARTRDLRRDRPTL